MDCYQAWLVCKLIEWSYTYPEAALLVDLYIPSRARVVGLGLDLVVHAHHHRMVGEKRFS